MKTKVKFALLSLVVAMGIGILLASAPEVKAQGQAIGRVMFKNDQGQWVQYMGKNITRKEEGNATIIEISGAESKIISVPPVGLRLNCGGGPGVICGQIYIVRGDDITTIRCVRPPDNVVCVFTEVGGDHGGPGER